MNDERVNDRLFQALQAEEDGSRFYETAIRCALNAGTPGRDAARHIGQSLVDAMEPVLRDGPSARRESL